MGNNKNTNGKSDENKVLKDNQKPKIKILEDKIKNFNGSIKIEDINEILSQWRKNFIEPEIDFKRYTNVVSNGECLHHFLENTSKVFGYSRGGSQDQYMVAIDISEKGYYIFDKNAEEGNAKVAEEVYNTVIGPLINYLVKGTLFDDGKLTFGPPKKINVEKVDDKEVVKRIKEKLKNNNSDKKNKGNNKDKKGANKAKKSLQENSSNNENDNFTLECVYNAYSAKQVLDKIVVLRSFDEQDKKLGIEKYSLLLAYKKEFFDWVWTDILEHELTEDNFEKLYTIEKNYKITKELYEKFFSDNNGKFKYDEEKTIILYKCIYGIYNYKDFLDNELNIIYHGAPGTGKTYFVDEGLKNIGVDDNHKEKIQCHVNFNYEDFIEGIKPIGLVNGTLQLEVVSGKFKKFCIKAKKALLDSGQNDKKDFYFICDEINRTNVAEMFGETLAYIEEDYRDNPDKKEERHLVSTPLSNVIKEKIKNLITENKIEDCKNFIEENVYELSYEKNNNPNYLRHKDIDSIIEDWLKDGKINEEVFQTIEIYFGIPKNIRFIGMMNDVDKSIDSFDLALRRRFKWIKKSFDKKVLLDELSEYDKCEDYVKKCDNLNNYIENDLKMGDSYQFGHSYFLKIKKLAKGKKITSTAKTELFNNYLEPILKEYLRSFFDESEIETQIRECKNKFGIGKSKDDNNDKNDDADEEQDAGEVKGTN